MSNGDGWQVKIGPHGGADILEAQQLQALIYDKLGFITEAHALTNDGVLLDHWSPASTHYAAFLHDEAVGHLRLIDRRQGPLPVETMVEGLELPEGCVEVSSLAVTPEHLDGHPAMLMYRRAFHYSTDAGATHWACVLEQRLLDTLTDFFNFPFVVVGPEIEYAGTTVPAVVDLQAVWDRVETGEVDSWFGR